jgi:hypothetical protein
MENFIDWEKVTVKLPSSNDFRWAGQFLKKKREVKIFSM